VQERQLVLEELGVNLRNGLGRALLGLGDRGGELVRGARLDLGQRGRQTGDDKGDARLLLGLGAGHEAPTEIPCKHSTGRTRERRRSMSSHTPTITVLPLMFGV
jgi:hypothetical protein